MATRGRNAVETRRTTARLVIRTGTVLGVAGGSLVASAAPASAATLVVNTTVDDVTVEGSLRWALDNASTGDVITFDFQSDATIELTEGELPVSVPVEIQGPGADALTIDADDGNEQTPGTRAFYVYADAPGTVTISGLTITGGDVNGPGGGILATGDSAGSDAVLRLADVVLHDNRAVEGGGLFFDSGTLEISQSTVSGNTAVAGAGVLVDGRFGAGGGIDGVSIDDSYIQGNVAEEKYGGLGIRGVDGDVSISSSVIGGDQDGTENVAGRIAGGVGMMEISGQATITDSTISGNTAGDTAGGLKYGGGGMLRLAANAEINAQDAGSFDELQLETGGLTIERSTISGNAADGGAGVSTYGGAIALIDSEVDDNQARYGAGGVLGIDSHVHIERSTISRNVADGSEGNGGPGGIGGGLYLAGSLLTTANSTISGNVAAAVGGGIFAVSGTSYIDSSTVASNQAGEYAGGIMVQGGEIFVEDPQAFVVADPGEETSPHHLRNSILADNSAGTTGDDLVGTIESDHSLIEDHENGRVLDQGGTIDGQDPQLLPLADNGGFTETHLPSPSSEAVDNGVETELTTDQRSEARPVGDGVDIGSVELQDQAPPPPTPPVDPVDPADPADESPCVDTADAGFADVGENNVHKAAIDCLKHLGITVGGPEGQPPTEYGPELNMTRGQMATFLVRLIGVAGLDLPENAADAFPDDDSSAHAGAIDVLAAVSIVEGRQDGTYGPLLPVRRDQMASFLRRTHDFISDGTLAAGEDAFDDDDGNVHEAAIDALAEAGVIEGTATPGTYDPSGDVRRDQMASFLIRLADLLASEGNYPVDVAE